MVHVTAFLRSRPIERDRTTPPRHRASSPAASRAGDRAASAGVRIGHRPARYLSAMGFNPHRQYRRSNADYLMVARRRARLPVAARLGAVRLSDGHLDGPGQRAARPALPGAQDLPLPRLQPGRPPGARPPRGRARPGARRSPALASRLLGAPAAPTAWSSRGQAGPRRQTRHQAVSDRPPTPTRTRSASPPTGRRWPTGSISPTSARASAGSRSSSSTATRRPSGSGGATSLRWPRPASR